MKLTKAAIVASTMFCASVAFSQQTMLYSHEPLVYNPTLVTNVPVTRLAPVINVVPIQQRGMVSELRHVCGTTNVPVYRNVPVVAQYHSPAAPLVGLLLGAAIGHGVAGAAHGASAALVGAAVGYSVGTASQRAVVGYNTEIVGYQPVQTCQQVHHHVERMITIAYTVTYDDNGTQRTITMQHHPGAHVRISYH